MNSPYGLPCIENCMTCHLRSESFFCNLPMELLEAFDKIKHATVYPENAVIFMEGQSPRGIFMLCQGQAKLAITSRNGKSFILRIAKAGDILGLDATVSGKPYEVTVETMQPCQLNFVSRKDFLPFLKEHGDACLHAAQHLSRDYQGACHVVRSIGLSHSVSGRLAKFLLESSAEGKDVNGEVRAKLSLNQEEISQLIGTSRETVTRTLSEFRKMRIVELNGSTLIVHNKTALRDLVAA